MTSHTSLMDRDQEDHPKFVTKSTLTTDGDIFIRASANVTRLGVGAATHLGVSSGLPAWQLQTYVDHGSISGLADDDHTQYALLAGRSGGQTRIGRTGSGDDLTLSSTSRATKGSVFIGSSLLFESDQTAGRLHLPTGGKNAGIAIGAATVAWWAGGYGGPPDNTTHTNSNAIFHVIGFYDQVANDFRTTGPANAGARFGGTRTNTTAGNVNWSAAVYSGIVDKTSTGNFGTLVMVDVVRWAKGSGSPSITTMIGLRIDHDGPAGFVPTAIGADILAIGSGTTSIGLRIAAPYGSTNYAFQLSDTGGMAAGGITFGTDLQLYRGAANQLYLASGDDLKLVSGDVIVDANTKGIQFIPNTDAGGATVDDLTTKRLRVVKRASAPTSTYLV